MIGAGAWGTALAQTCARAGLEVVLWAREPEVVHGIEETRENRIFLPGVSLDAAIRATGDPADLRDVELVFAVPPAQHLRATLAAFAQHLSPEAPVVLCAKGIEQVTL